MANCPPVWDAGWSVQPAEQRLAEGPQTARAVGPTVMTAEGAADGQEGWASGWTVGHGGKRSCSDQGLHSRGASCRKCESGLPRQPHLHTEARTALTLGPGAHKVPGWGALTFPNSAPAQL